MLASTNQNIHDAVTTVIQLTQEEKIRQQCEAREDYIRRTAGREKLLIQTTEERDQARAERDQAYAENQRLREELERLKNRDNSK